ncbi:MAG: hypothetical protein ACREBR_02645, partial [bacterium]
MLIASRAQAKMRKRLPHRPKYKSPSPLTVDEKRDALAIMLPLNERPVPRSNNPTKDPLTPLKLGEKRSAFQVQQILTLFETHFPKFWDHFDRNVNGHIKIRNLMKRSAREDTCPMQTLPNTNLKKLVSPNTSLVFASTTTNSDEQEEDALPNAN